MKTKLLFLVALCSVQCGLRTFAAEQPRTECEPSQLLVEAVPQVARQRLDAQATLFASIGPDITKPIAQELKFSPCIVNNTNTRTIGWLSLCRSNMSYFFGFFGNGEEDVRNHEVLIDDRNKIAPGDQYPFIIQAHLHHYVLNVCAGIGADWNTFEDKPLCLIIALVPRSNNSYLVEQQFIRNVILNSNSTIYVNDNELKVATPGKPLASYKYESR